MPRFFIDTFDSLDVRDEGRDFTNLAAARSEVRRTLAAMLQDATDDRPTTQFRAEVRDASGQRMLTATLLMVVDEENAA